MSKHATKSEVVLYGHSKEEEFTRLARERGLNARRIGGSSPQTDVEIDLGNRTISVEVKASRYGISWRDASGRNRRAYQFYLMGNGRSNPVNDDVVALGCDDGMQTTWFIIPGNKVRNQKRINIAHPDQTKWNEYRERWETIEALN